MEEFAQKLQAAVADLVPGAPLAWCSVGPLEGYFLDQVAASRPLPADRVEKVMRDPPFWALLWPSGESLCRALQARPDLVKGLSVLDFGSGCGLVACAAARAGARVVAVDCDPLAVAACQVNAARNQADVRVRKELGKESADLLLLADFLYDASHLPLFETLKTVATEVLVVDSRLQDLPDQDFRFLGTATGQAVPDLDPHGEFGLLRFWYRGSRRPDWEAALGLPGPVAR